MNRVKIYVLFETPLRRPAGKLLPLIWLLQRDFWTGAINGGLMILGLGWAGLRWFGQGDAAGWWLPAQMVLVPLLMAVEEYLHAVVAGRKEISAGIIDVAVMYKGGRNGFSWLCCGAAVRCHGTVTNRNRIHIASPGPVFCLVLMGLIWLICGLLDQRPWWGRAHRLALPLLSYLASAWLPLPAVPTSDVAVIRRAGQEEGLSSWQIFQECWRGVRCIWYHE
jgi:hypothetical protein